MRARLIVCVGCVSEFAGVRSRELSFADFELTAPVGHTVDIKGDAEARKSEDSGDAIKVYAGPGCVFARVSFVVDDYCSCHGCVSPL